MLKESNRIKRRLEPYQLRRAHLHPLEVVRAEHITVFNGFEDAEGDHPRPISISIISDEATRMPTGIGIAVGITPLHSFVLALRHMLAPKHESDNNWPVGAPNMIYADRGDMFASESLALIAQKLQIQVHISNGQPAQSALMRMVTKQLPKIASTFIDINSVINLLYTFLNERYVRMYQKELGDIPMNRWQKELEAGWKPIIPAEDKVRQAFSQLREEDN